MCRVSISIGHDPSGLRLESAMVITVSPNAGAQNAHLDTEDAGSVSVHVPLQPLHEGKPKVETAVGVRGSMQCMGGSQGTRGKNRRELGVDNAVWLQGSRPVS